jgi:hypothetical protein
VRRLNERRSARCDFVKDGRLVASKECPGLSCEEAVQTAQTMFAENASSYGGVESGESYAKDLPAGRRSPQAASEIVRSTEVGRERAVPLAVCDSGQNNRPALAPPPLKL